MRETWNFSTQLEFHSELPGLPGETPGEQDVKAVNMENNASEIYKNHDILDNFPFARGWVAFPSCDEPLKNPSIDHPHKFRVQKNPV
jgi:hypothetical protein